MPRPKFLLNADSNLSRTECRCPRAAPRLFDSNRSPTTCQASGVKEIWLFCLRPVVKARRLIGISGPGASPQSDSHSISSDSFVAQLPAGLRSPLFSYLIAHQMPARIVYDSYKSGIGMQRTGRPRSEAGSLWCVGTNGGFLTVFLRKSAEIWGEH
jgi:hypothetical protein